MKTIFAMVCLLAWCSSSVSSPISENSYYVQLSTSVVSGDKFENPLKRVKRQSAAVGVQSPICPTLGVSGGQPNNQLTRVARQFGGTGAQSPNSRSGKRKQRRRGLLPKGTII